jgi:hypothetical protein
MMNIGLPVWLYSTPPCLERGGWNWTKGAVQDCTGGCCPPDASKSSLGRGARIYRPRIIVSKSSKLWLLLFQVRASRRGGERLVLSMQHASKRGTDNCQRLSVRHCARKDEMLTIYAQNLAESLSSFFPHLRIRIKERQGCYGSLDAQNPAVRTQLLRCCQPKASYDEKGT